MGRMRIRSVGLPGGTNFNVEEYKRPKFKVEVEAPKDAFKLDDTVKVPGKAMQYNGVPVGLAKVAYRVTREVRYPDWFFEYRWWRPVPVRRRRRSPAASCRPNSTAASPSRSRPSRTCRCRRRTSRRSATITADVTDTTGETRTGTKAVQVGYVALRAKVSSEAWLEAAEGTEVRVNDHARRRRAGGEGHARFTR